jgi:DNA-binding beta-propeller fold protein YncE
VDTRTLEIVEQIPLANGPHNLSASHRARKVYVAIIAEPLVQVIDMDTHEVIRNIRTAGGVHNTFVTPDGRHAVGGMIGASEIIVIDTETDEVVWELAIDYTENPFTGGVRPIAFTTHPDGSTRSMLVNVGGWQGFWEFDWETQEVLNRISPPEHAWKRTEQTADGIQSAPSHGIVVLPDQSQVWTSSRATSHIYGWSLPDYEYLGRVYIGNPAWLTATPDSRYIWVGVASHNETAVVDVQTQEVIQRFPVGQSPKRIFTAIFPHDWTGEQQ